MLCFWDSPFLDTACILSVEHPHLCLLLTALWFSVGKIPPSVQMIRVGRTPPLALEVGKGPRKGPRALFHLVPATGLGWTWDPMQIKHSHWDLTPGLLLEGLEQVMFQFGIIVTGSPPMILRRMLISEWGQCRRKEMKEKERNRSFKSIHFSSSFVLFEQIWAGFLEFAAQRV